MARAMSDLVERLSEYARAVGQPQYVERMCNEAAAEIKSLRADRDALKKVVEEASDLIALELRDYHTGLDEAESEAWQARAKALLSREETK
jgi:hypothetical protein